MEVLAGVGHVTMYIELGAGFIPLSIPLTLEIDGHLLFI